jgi:hypothetical protein
MSKLEKKSTSARVLRRLDDGRVVYLVSWSRAPVLLSEADARRADELIAMRAAIAAMLGMIMVIPILLYFKGVLSFPVATLSDALIFSLSFVAEFSLGRSLKTLLKTAPRADFTLKEKAPSFAEILSIVARRFVEGLDRRAVRAFSIALGGWLIGSTMSLLNDVLHFAPGKENNPFVMIVMLMTAIISAFGLRALWRERQRRRKSAG